MSIAGLFPGQGSQSSGMLADMAVSFPLVTDVFQEASDELGRDLWAIAQTGAESELNHTENTQPLMLAAGVACFKVWQAQSGKMPSAYAGHSLGEYSALVASGVLEFKDAVRLIAERSRLMQNAVPEGQGAMAAVLGLEDDQVIAACAQAAQEQVVEAVNFNSPGQIVIGGDSAAVNRAVDIAREMGAKKVVPLSMSVPSHCALMRPVAEELAETLGQTNFTAGQFPVLHNIDASPRTESGDIRDAVAQQLYQPVRWTDTIKSLQAEHKASVMLEFGPGKVLTGLNRRIERRMKAACIFDPKSLESALTLVAENT